MKDNTFIIVMIVCFILSAIGISIASYEYGILTVQRDAVLNDHAIWSCDEDGDPLFMWKGVE